MTGGGRIQVTIRIDRAKAADFAKIVAGLEKLGLSDVEARPRFLIVNASAPAGALDSIRKLEGVASVHEDRSYRAL